MTVLVFAAALLFPPAVAAAPAARADPPVRVKLSDDFYARGERARVKVKTDRDGYLLVLQADPAGRVRVLYPLDPTDEGTIRGGKEFEVRSRGDREAFTVSDRAGGGIVLAAIADQPFRFEEFTRNGHWDYRALAARNVEPDPEAALLELVDRMAAGPYDYDLAHYTVSNRAYSRRYAGWHGPYWRWGWYPPYPGYWDWWYGPRFGATIIIPFGHRHEWGRRW
jgi:hypothetical protein